jgi:hypothetical protein
MSDNPLTSPFDAVILAGGQSSRLAGIVPPYHKPFLVVEGEALVLRAVRQAELAHAQRIIIVTCAEIALPLVGLLEHSNADASSIHVLIKTGGPGAALREGLLMCRNERVLTLMADNHHTDYDVQVIARQRYAIGVRWAARDETRSFTRWIDGEWVEGPDAPVTDANAGKIWCGPLMINRSRGLEVLDLSDGLIGPHLDALVPTFDDTTREETMFDVISDDLGTPEATTLWTGGRVNSL